MGQSAPEFSLPDSFGKEVSLKTLLAQGPVVISLHRGEWCPFCNIELRGLQAALPQMDNKGIVSFAPVDADYMIGRVEPETVISVFQTMSHPVAQ